MRDAANDPRISSKIMVVRSRPADEERGPRQTYRVEHRADHEHAFRAIAICDVADERLRRAPHQVLQRNGEGEHFATPFHIGRNRLQEKARERVSRAHGNAQYDGDCEECAEHELIGGHSMPHRLAREGEEERRTCDASDAGCNQRAKCSV